MIVIRCVRVVSAMVIVSRYQVWMVSVLVFVMCQVLVISGMVIINR